MFSFLNDQEFGAHRHDGFGRLYEGEHAGQLAGFSIIHDQHIDIAENDLQIRHGNIHPEIHGIQELKQRPKLIAMDTMNFWMDIAMPDLKIVLRYIDMLIVNDAEARQLTGMFSLVKAAKSIMAMGPKFLIIKKGEHGALLFHCDEVFYAPALPLEDVFDPTGAGDTFAGGFMGHIAKTGDISFENMKRGIIVGSAMASFCVEKFGPTRLKEITADDINTRLQQFKNLVSFDIELV